VYNHGAVHVTAGLDKVPAGNGEVLGALEHVLLIGSLRAGLGAGIIRSRASIAHPLKGSPHSYDPLFQAR